MTELHKALYKFWSQFGMPAYLSGHVPDGSAFPYVTFDVAEGAPFGQNVLTAFGWFKAQSGENVNAIRAAFLDDVAAAIPRDGAQLFVNGKRYITIFRNDAQFLSYYDDPEDKTIIGGRISYIVTYYL